MAEDLTGALEQLRAALVGLRLPLDLPGVQQQRSTAAELVDQLDDYVLPRLATLDAPLLTVVGGSTGAGKSTLVNSLVRRVVTQPGVIRPTTKSPVLVHHPDDTHWFTDERILPGLARSTGPSTSQSALQLVAEPTLPPGLALLDAPDIDSVNQRNRELASQLLAAADLWLFVTSAARYADAVPWEYLRAAAERSAALGLVLSRVPPAAMDDVPPHLGQMMTERGLGDSPLFAVPETTTDAQGLLPDAAVSPIRGWLSDIAADSSARQRVVHQTLAGAVHSLTRRAPLLAQAVDDQVESVLRLRDDADAHYADAITSVTTQTADGTLLKGEVLARWHDFVGTGEFFRAMERKVSWVRDRVTNFFRARPNGADDVKIAVESGLETLLIEEGAAAAERTESAWRANPVGRSLLAATPEDLRHHSADFPLRASRLIRDWQADVMELVAGEGMGKRSKARFLAFGVNGVGVALMIVAFAQTGGLVGAEVGVAGGTALVAQKVLEAVFGDDAVRKLSQQAKQLLDDRVQVLFSEELARYHQTLASQQVEPQQADRLRSAIAAVQAQMGELPALDAATQVELGAADTPALGTGEQLEQTLRHERAEARPEPEER